MRLAIALLISILIAPGPVAASELLKADVPPWVEDIALPAVDPAMLPYTTNGIYYLLTEEQDLWQGQRRFSHERIAVKVLSRAGLEQAASFLRAFDPEVETLTLTRLDILRDGKRISLRDSVTANLLRRESDLDQGMINGMLTAHFEVPGLQVGDILDAGFMWQSDPLFPGQTFAGTYDHEFSTPVGLSRLVLNWPKDKPISIGPDMTGVTRLDTVTGDLRRITLSQSAHPPLEPEGDLLPEANPWRLVNFTAAESWADVVAPLSGFYDALHPVPAGLAPDVAAIQKTRPNQTQQVYAALHLVQDKVRYVGIEVGKGGYYARDPAEVAATGYGDCKDKSLLLVTLLRAMGITADVALADLDQGYGLIDHLPMAGAFDHMIVRAIVDGKPLWLDGTGSYEGGDGFGAAPPDLGYALPITGLDHGKLARIAAHVPGADAEHVHETFTFTKAGVDLDVLTVAKGSEADRIRWRWASRAQHDIEQSFKGYYADLYPGIEQVAPIAVDDRMAVNQIEVRETYHLPQAALADTDLTRDFGFEAAGFNDILPTIDPTGRSAPVYVGALTERSHEVTIINPPTSLEPPDGYTITDRAFTFAFEGRVDALGTLTLIWHFTPKARSIDAGYAETFAGDVSDLKDQLRQSYDVTPDPVHDPGLFERLFNAMQEKASAAGPPPAP